MNFEKFDTVIFKNQYGYSTGISRKKQDSEEYVNAFLDVRFRKGVNVDNLTKISVKKAFLSFNHNDKTNKNYFYIFIDEFDILGKITKKEDSLDQEKEEVDKIIEQMNSVSE